MNTEFQFQAYQLIPEETFSNELGQKFNEGIKDALQNIPFFISRDGQLVKIEDAIIDFTFLSEKFVGCNIAKAKYPSPLGAKYAQTLATLIHFFFLFFFSPPITTVKAI